MYKVSVFPPFMGEQTLFVQPCESRLDVQSSSKFDESMCHIVHSNLEHILSVSVLSGWNIHQIQTRFQWVPKEKKATNTTKTIQSHDVVVVGKENPQSLVKTSHFMEQMQPHSVLFETTCFRMIPSFRKQYTYHIECVHPRHSTKVETIQWLWRHTGNLEMEVVPLEGDKWMKNNMDPTFQMYWFFSHETPVHETDPHQFLHDKGITTDADTNHFETEPTLKSFHAFEDYSSYLDAIQSQTQPTEENEYSMKNFRRSNLLQLNDGPVPQNRNCSDVVCRPVFQDIIHKTIPSFHALSQKDNNNHTNVSDVNWERMMRSLGYEYRNGPTGENNNNNKAVVSDVLHVQAVYPNTDVVIVDRTNSSGDIDSEEMLSSTKWIAIVFFLILFGILFLFLVASICSRLQRNRTVSTPTADNLVMVMKTKNDTFPFHAMTVTQEKKPQELQEPQLQSPKRKHKIQQTKRNEEMKTPF